MAQTLLPVVELRVYMKPESSQRAPGSGVIGITLEAQKDRPYNAMVACMCMSRQGLLA
jgi:hypothetical protein